MEILLEKFADGKYHPFMYDRARNTMSHEE